VQGKSWGLLAINPHGTHNPAAGHFECNRLWVLKNSLIGPI
jgi:hypothetical protein